MAPVTSAIAVRTVPTGAAARLTPSGWLMIVTEVPAIERAHRWLLAEDASGALRLRVVFNPRHVQSADGYAADRSRERVAADGRAGAAADVRAVWARALSALRALRSLIHFSERAARARAQMEVRAHAGRAGAMLPGAGPALPPCRNVIRRG